jgi:PIN domain nuclease of toxin-antitoxin system
MRLLLDTHALLWWLSGDPRLSAAATNAIATADNLVWVSAATAWEITRKNALGKLPGVETLIEHFEDEMRQERFGILALRVPHLVRAARYAAEHRDPFDRILAAQAEIEGLRLVSIDPKIDTLAPVRFW